MKLSSVVLALATSLPSSCSAFTLVPRSMASTKSTLSHDTRIFLSDDQPSDSSGEELYDTVDVESEPFEPTPTESLINSILDDIPSSVAGDVSKETRARINEELFKLETMNPTENPTTSPLLNGVWSLRYSGGYSSDWALPSPTRQLALFLYSGGYSPGLFALSLAQQLPAGLVEVGELEISISREQPRVQADVGVTLLGGTENKVTVRARLDVESGVRLTETYEAVANVLDRVIELPPALQYSRDLYITYLDDDLLVVRDASGVPEILIRK